jgi:hypothetical protein
MTADAPMGEYLELVPKSAYDLEPSARPKRILHPEVRDPIYRTGLSEPAVPGTGPTATERSALERRAVPRPAPAQPDPATERTDPPTVKAKVLKPG